MLPRRLRFRHTTLLIVLCACFLVGIGLARRVYFDAAPVLWMAGIVAALLWRKKGFGCLLTLAALGLLCGMWRGSAGMVAAGRYSSLMKRPVVITAVAETDAVYGERSQLSFEASRLTVTDPVRTTLAGKIRVAGFGVPMVYKGDTVQIEGKLYPTRGAAQASISFAELAVLQRDNSFINAIRRRFIAGLQSVLPEPQASFGAGLLIGQRSTLPKLTSDQLSITGLTHLVAVSGYNLTILVGASRRLLGGRSKFQGTIISLGLIAAFVLLTGLSASIVRAALVSILSLGAWYYGRTFRPVLLLLLVAAVTAWWNPFYVWSDIGWYLSFCAFFGVLVLAPLLARRLSGTKRPKLLTMVLLETAAAQLMTMPLIMYIFGRVSVIGLLANVLVVPLVPLAMLGALCAGLAGMLAPAVGGWVAWPARLLLTYMLDVTAVLSRLPRALIEQSIQLWQMAGLYVTVLAFTVVIWHKTRAKTGILTDEEQEAGEF